MLNQLFSATSNFQAVELFALLLHHGEIYGFDEIILFAEFFQKGIEFLCDSIRSGSFSFSDSIHSMLDH